jgi:D-alanyl-D-alanine carboxypeptidase
MRIKAVAISVVVLALLAGGGTWWRIAHRQSYVSNSVQNSNSTTTQPATNSDGFNKTKYSLTDPTSLWVVANKQHPIQPVNYVPADLTVPSVPLVSPGADNMQMRAATASAITQLFANAKQAGLNLEVVSGYRSYTYQQTVYSRYVTRSGQTTADQESARPGYSEHQTGLAVDIGAASGKCALEACLGTTPEGQWLAANAYRYGFILRYPADKVTVTGYEYEPWHFRYVGTGLSSEMHQQDIETLEEFFGVTGGTVYKAGP